MSRRSVDTSFAKRKAGAITLCASVMFALTLATPSAAGSPPAQHEPTQAARDNLPSAIRKTLQRAVDDLRRHPTAGAVAGRLAMLLHAHEQHRAALRYYELAARLEPNSMRWSYLTGVVHAELGANEEAIVAFRRALGANSTFLPARLKLAEVLMVDGDLAASRLEYEQLLRRFPELALAHYGLGGLLGALGDHRGAIREFQQAVDLAPQFGPAHYALALVLRRMGDPESVADHLEAYRKFGALRPRVDDPILEEVRSLVGTARELIFQGTQAAAAGRFAEAILLHIKALEADPTAAQAHVNLISLYGRVGRANDAERHYREAVRLGNSADAHYNYGVLLASAGEYTRAAEAFSRAVAADPFHARAHNNLGALAAQHGRGEEAIQHYRQALASDPRHDSARFGVGRVLMTLGRVSEAIEQFERLVTVGGKDVARYRQALARAYFAAGDEDQAIQEAERAVLEAILLGDAKLTASLERELTRMRAGRQ